MSASTKLSNAVKALCFLARHSPKPQSSSTISRNTGVNASKLRKLLAALATIDVVSALQGASGGYILTKSPKEIHLQEIYCAIEDRKAFHLDVTKLKPEELEDAAAINIYFLELFGDIQVEIEDKLRKISLESLISDTSSTNIFPKIS